MSRGQHAEAAQRLDYAELALQNGDPATALTSVSELLEDEGADLTRELSLRARTLRASSLEAVGDYPAAISELEALVEDAPRDQAWIVLVTALSRCHRQSGDFARAIGVADAAESEIERQHLEDTEEAIRLAVTVAAAHVERGDVRYALRLCERAAERADAIGSVRALASAYWNASVCRSELGEPLESVMLATAALEGFEACGDLRAQRLLHQALALSSLELTPPEVDAAEHHVARALQMLEWSDARAVERAYIKYAVGKVALARGDLEAARAAADESFAITADSVPSLAGFTSLLLGRIALTEHDREAAGEHFQRAVLLLSSCGQDRAIAQAWFDLGTLLQRIGDAEAAIDAFRRAAVATGVVRPEAVPVGL